MSTIDLLTPFKNVPNNTRVLVSGASNKYLQHNPRNLGYSGHTALWSQNKGMRTGSSAAPGAGNGWSRTLSTQRLPIPYTFTTEFVLQKLLRTDQSYWGVHFHVGHQNNDNNYAISLRRDGRAVMLQEYKDQYSQLSPFVPFDLQVGRRYRVDIRFNAPKDITVSVDGKQLLEVTAHERFPAFTTGNVGWRLDNTDTRIIAARAVMPKPLEEDVKLIRQEGTATVFQAFGSFKVRIVDQDVFRALGYNAGMIENLPRNHFLLKLPTLEVEQ